MKLFAAALAFVLFPATVAFAAPGSTSQFAGTYTCGEKTDSLQTKYTIVTETPKEGGGIYAEVLVARIHGTTGQTGERNSGSYVNGEKFNSVKDVEKYCRVFRGSFGKLATPAGTFWTCKLSGRSGGWATTTWVGRAPLGIVAFKSTMLKPTKKGCYPVIEQKISSFSF